MSQPYNYSAYPQPQYDYSQQSTYPSASTYPQPAYPQQYDYSVYQQAAYPPAATSTAAANPPKKKEDGWTKKYFYWFTPAMGIWFFLAFCIIILSWFTVGCGFSSVCEACGTWSFDLATSQNG